MGPASPTDLTQGGSSPVTDQSGYITADHFAVELSIVDESDANPGSGDNDGMVLDDVLPNTPDVGLGSRSNVNQDDGNISHPNTHDDMDIQSNMGSGSGELQPSADASSSRVRSSSHSSHTCDGVTVDLSLTMANDGDIVLRASNASQGTAQFRVKSSRLREYRKWSAFLDEHVATMVDAAATRGESSGLSTSRPELPVHDIQDADPEAVAILLHVMHSNFWELPTIVSFETIHQLAALCDRFEVADLMRCFLASWLQRYALDYPQSTEAFLNSMYVSWVFKFQGWFESTLHYLVCTMRNPEEVPERCAGQMLRWVQESRNELLQNLIGITTKYADEEFWYKYFKCEVDSANRTCVEHAYVAFMVKLRALKLWPTRPSVSEICDSAVGFREKIYGISILPYSHDHSSCCSDFMRLYHTEVLCTTYDMDESRYIRHFQIRGHEGKQSTVTFTEESIISFMGTHLFEYGFEAEDFGYASVLDNYRWRQPGDVKSTVTTSDVESEEDLYDNLESDYESDSAWDSADSTTPEEYLSDGTDTF